MAELGVTEDVEFFYPSADVRRQAGALVLYAVVGPSGSGKDSIMDKVVDLQPDLFGRVIGDTNREPREGEVDGITYHFRSKEDFKKDFLAERYLQVAQGPQGNLYGTRLDQYPKDKVGLLAVLASEMPKFQRLNLKKLEWLQIVPPSDEAWQEWYGSHGHTAEDNHRRMEEAVFSYSQSLLASNTRFVLNDEVSKAAERVIQIANGQRPADEQKAKAVAVKNMEALKKRLAQD